MCHLHDGRKRIRIKKGLLAVGLDAVLSLIVPYIAGPVDLWETVLRGIAKKAAKSELGRKRFIIVWDELMTCQVPKISGYLGGCATKIRTAIWRSTGVVVGNATAAYMGDTVSYYNRWAEKKFSGSKTAKKITEMIKFALNFTSLGSIVAFALEKGDGVNNENYVYFNI